MSKILTFLCTCDEPPPEAYPDLPHAICPTHNYYYVKIEEYSQLLPKDRNKDFVLTLRVYQRVLEGQDKEVGRIEWRSYQSSPSMTGSGMPGWSISATILDNFFDWISESYDFEDMDVWKRSLAGIFYDEYMDPFRSGIKRMRRAA